MVRIREITYTPARGVRFGALPWIVVFAGLIFHLGLVSVDLTSNVIGPFAVIILQENTFMPHCIFPCMVLVACLQRFADDEGGCRDEEEMACAV